MTGELDFGLLGPLVVRRDGVDVPVPVGNQRAVLAALLLSAGRTARLDALAEAVWGDRPPVSARATLQNYVKRLRHALCDGSRAVIATLPAGYQIRVAAEAIDVCRFEALQGSARQAALRGEWGQAADLLCAALALWRGEPLADTGSELLRQRHAPRLAEMHAQAIEARADAYLHLGRPHEVVTDLRQHAAANPLRERFHGLLMLALYRCGRQAEALAAYRQARRTLIGELGVEPGPELRELHQRILTGDPGLMTVKPRPAATAGPAATTRPAATAGPAATSRGVGAAEGTGPAGPDGGGQDAGEARPRAQGEARPRAQGEAWPRAQGEPSWVPHQLPAGVRHFCGRAGELAALAALASQALDRHGQTVVISAIGGTAGIGKSALAVHFAHQVAARFSGGQLYVNLRGFDPSGPPLTAAEAIRGFLDALAAPSGQIPVSIDGQAALYRSLLAGRRMLILLDNARDADQVRPLVPGSPGCLVLVTSRSQLAGLAVTGGADPITLDVLSDAEAAQLLARRLGQDRLAREPEAAAELTRLCARLPLALVIVASRAAAHPGFALAALAEELRGTRGRLDALGTGEPATDVRAAFSCSYRHLPAPAARMFRLLSVHPGPDITAAAAASLAGLPLPQTRRDLGKLTSAGLLAEHAPGRYAFHDLLRVYAAERAERDDSESQRRDAASRVLDHYLHTALAADRLVYPARAPITLAPAHPGAQPERLADAGHALAWFDAERPVLLAAIAHAADNGFDAHAWQIPWTLRSYFERVGHWHEWAQTQGQALAAAQRTGDPAARAQAHRELGLACLRIGNCGDAREHLLAALSLAREVGDRAGQARCHLTLGQVLDQQGSHREALRHDKQALGLLRQADDRGGEAVALNAIGYDYVHLGRHEAAIPYCERAVDLSRELGDAYGEAASLDSLGSAHLHLGSRAKAIACFDASLTICRRIGDRGHLADALVHLGEALHRDGGVARARDAWREALAILDDLDHPDAGQVRAKLRSLPRAEVPGRPGPLLDQGTR